MSDTDRTESDDLVAAPPTTEMRIHGVGTSEGAPETTDFGAGIDDPDYISVRLPPVLEAIFEPIRELASGGQATLLLCRRRDDPSVEVAVKLYRTDAGATKIDPRENFRNLSPEHVVTYVEPYFGLYNKKWWEVQEYLPEGNLRELARSQGGKLSSGQISELLSGLADALADLHSRKPRIIHRDIKPENLLVRRRDPLHVVLADFGLAVLTEMSHEQHSGSRTDAYAAPEAPSGDTDPPLDWWSLGMTIAELAAGRHPYTLADGRFMNARGISSAIATRPVPLEGIDDERLVLLLRGLLTRDPERRWRAAEVRTWLEGGNPDVAADEAPAPTVAPAGQGKRVDPFPFMNRDFTDPGEIGEAIAQNWSRAGGLFVGRDDLRRLVEWVEANFPDHSIAEVAQKFDGLREKTERDINVLVARVVIRLNPTGTPLFMGEAVDMASLGDWATRINTDAGKHLGDVVEWLFHSRLLLDYRRLPGLADLARVEETWQDMSDAAVGWFKQVPEAGTMTPEIRALILRVAVAKVAGVEA